MIVNLDRGIIVETIFSIENPESIKATGLDLVVEALTPQLGDGIICAKLVTTLCFQWKEK